eukprot:5767617-Alexandrium_andersonii.AAC.1
MLAGNSIHIPCIAAWLAYVFSNCMFKDQLEAIPSCCVSPPHMGDEGATDPTDNEASESSSGTGESSSSSSD